MTQPSVMFPSPVHWSKDFVEHLRTVHFALIGAATGLILIVLSAKPYDPAIALRQIHQIIELKKMWSRDWLVGRGTVKYISFSTAESYPQSSFDLSAVGTGQLGFPQPLGEIAERFYAEVLDKRGRQQGVVQFSVEGESRWMQDFPRGWSAEAFPNTLADFQKWWDFLEMHHYKAIFPLTVAYTTGEAIANGGPRLLPINESEGLQEKSPDRVSLALGFRGYAPIYGGSGRFGSYSLSVERLSYVEVSQESIVAQFRNWKVGPFNSTFTDLFHATRDLEGLELDDVERFMSSEAAKGTEVFEAFGMKFPAGQITLWGIVLLLSVQLYFFVYLKQLFGKLASDDAGWDVPWIGMDTSALARIIFFLTIVLLPCLATGLLSEHAIFRQRDPLAREGWAAAKTAALIAACLCAAALSLWSWKYRPRIRGSVESPAPASEETSNKSELPSDRTPRNTSSQAD